MVLLQPALLRRLQRVIAALSQKPIGDQRRIGIGCRYGFALLPPSSLPARDHPVRDLGSPRPSNRAHLGRDRKFADSPLEETVTSEPVSVFPDQRQNTAKFVDLRLTRRETAPFLEVYHWVKSHFPGVAEQGNFYIRSEKSKGLIREADR
jgi:hypothetical protein